MSTALSRAKWLQVSVVQFNWSMTAWLQFTGDSHAHIASVDCIRPHGFQNRVTSYKEIKQRGRTNSKQTAYLCSKQEGIWLVWLFMIWWRNARTTTRYALLQHNCVNPLLVFGVCEEWVAAQGQGWGRKAFSASGAWIYQTVVWSRPMSPITLIFYPRAKGQEKSGVAEGERAHLHPLWIRQVIYICDINVQKEREGGPRDS